MQARSRSVFWIGYIIRFLAAGDAPAATRSGWLGRVPRPAAGVAASPDGDPADAMRGTDAFDMSRLDWFGG
jgi:hypothetical protein